MMCQSNFTTGPILVTNVKDITALVELIHKINCQLGQIHALLEFWLFDFAAH